MARKRDKQNVSTTRVVTETAPGEFGLTGEEERLLRMRAGATVPDDEPLGSKLDPVVDPRAAKTAGARLTLIEAELLGILDEPEPGTADQAEGEAKKSRIIEALKQKSR